MLDGAIRLKKLAQRAAALGQKAVALTDHGNMFGALQFVKACKDAGVGRSWAARSTSSPARARTRRRARRGAPGAPRGRAWTSATQPRAHREPRLGRRQARRRTRASTLELLEQNREGLVALTAAWAAGSRRRPARRGEEARREARSDASARRDGARRATSSSSSRTTASRAGGAQRASSRRLAESTWICRSSRPTTATTSSARTRARSSSSQCIARAAARRHGARAPRLERDVPEERRRDGAALLATTPRPSRTPCSSPSAASGNVKPKLGKPKLPRFSVPEGVTEADWISQRSRARASSALRRDPRRRAARSTTTPTARASRSSSTSSCRWASRVLPHRPGLHQLGEGERHPRGPRPRLGRGLARRVRAAHHRPRPDPLRPPLRALPEPRARVDARLRRRLLHGPARRVIEYVRGRSTARLSVGQIATFHELKSRSVVKDVGRAFGMQPVDTRRASRKLVPRSPCRARPSPSEAIEQGAQAQGDYEERRRPSRAPRHGDEARGSEPPRGHARGGHRDQRGPLWDHVPVFCPERRRARHAVPQGRRRAAGLVKFDFLGLKTLTVIDIAVRLIDKRPDRAQGPDGTSRDSVRPQRDPRLDDKATFALSSRARRRGVPARVEGMQGSSRTSARLLRGHRRRRGALPPGPARHGHGDDFVNASTGA
jgi:DNA polymerase-3 subunit alpha